MLVLTRQFATLLLRLLLLVQTLLLYSNLLVFVTTSLFETKLSLSKVMNKTLVVIPFTKQLLKSSFAIVYTNTTLYTLYNKGSSLFKSSYVFLINKDSLDKKSFV
jgi:hypothetical protein